MRILSFIIFTCCFQVIVAQEIIIHLDQERTFNDTVCFNVKNCTNHDIWFYTHGLTAIVYIKDSNSLIIPPNTKSEADPLGIPKFVLIEARSLKSIYLPIGKILLQYNLHKDEEYYLFFEYKNFIKKPKSKINTFTGKVKINPLKL